MNGTVASSNCAPRRDIPPGATATATFGMAGSVCPEGRRRRPRSRYCTDFRWWITLAGASRWLA